MINDRIKEAFQYMPDEALSELCAVEDKALSDLTETCLDNLLELYKLMSKIRAGTKQDITTRRNAERLLPVLEMILKRPGGNLRG